MKPAVICVALVLGALAVVACAEPRVPHSATRVKCVESWPEARFRNYAFDHIVHLLSRCRTEVVCVVSTNVNPNRVRVEVPAGAQLEVLTYRGSPSREFTPTVQCELPRITVGGPNETTASVR